MPIARSPAKAKGDEKLTRAPRETFVSSTHKHHVWLEHSLTHVSAMQTQPPVVMLLAAAAVVAATMAICFYCFPDKIFSTAAIPATIPG